MKYLTAEEILRIHFNLIEDYGGAHGIRDEERTRLVIEAPKMMAFGQEQYATTFEKAAVYARNIIADHPFLDGNKRTGITAMGIFLIRNGCELTATPKELEDFAVQIAVAKLDVADIADWLKIHSRTSRQ